MTTIVFRNKELIFNDELLEGIPLFDSINNYDFKESEEKRISLDCHSSEFLLMIKYKLLLINDDKFLEKNIIDLCDYLCMNEIKQKYLDSHNNEYLVERDIISKKEYIFELIIEKESEIYFDDEKHFENFLESPNNVKYYDNENNGKNNILFYLTYKKYDLMEDAINYGLFDKIDINKYMKYYDSCIYTTSNHNILMFSCEYSKIYSSDKIVKMLLEHPNIDVNMMNYLGLSALTLVSMYLNMNSTYETLRMLLDHPDINVNLKNRTGHSALMILLRNNDELAIRMLLRHPDIDINLQNYEGSSALILASSDASLGSTIESSERTIKILLEHPNIDVNLLNVSGMSALMYASMYSNTGSTAKILLEHPNIDVNLLNENGISALYLASIYSNNGLTVKTLLEHPNIDVNLQNENGSTALLLASENQNINSREEIIKMLLGHPNIDINLYNYKGETIFRLALNYLYKGEGKEIVKMILENPDFKYF
jgi:ankyrin repeat protein